MKKYSAFLLTLAAAFLFSCEGKRKSAIAHRLQGSDSVVIQFFSEKEVLENAAVSADRKAIRELIGFVSGELTDSAGCAKGGQIIFYSNKKEIQRVVYKPECRQFDMNFEGKQIFTKMSTGAAYYLDAIEKGER